MSVAILVTTYNRPEALARSLPQIAALGVPVLVVDDGSAAVNRDVALQNSAIYLNLPSNRGLAAALNIGLSYWLADKSITHISYFQDDVDVHPKTLELMEKYQDMAPLLTGHDAAEHLGSVVGEIKLKKAIRATHMYAHRDFWKSIMPIPTNQIGTPKRTGASGRGMGSNVDWWIVRDSPNSVQKTGRKIICVPGMVRTFSLKAEDSCWGNAQAMEPPLAS